MRPVVEKRGSVQVTRMTALKIFFVVLEELGVVQKSPVAFTDRVR